MRKNDNSGHAAEHLTRILTQAIGAEADEVLLERVPEGLEIVFQAGPVGTGELLEDSELEEELMGLVVDRAKLEKRSQGIMTWSIHDRTYTIAVEEYDSFGEVCFRLRFKK